jgi:hypothetical protein
MNMKRGLVLSLCVLALGAFAQTAKAQLPTVDVSLNLRYTDPANPAEGGKFYLVAQSNAAMGLAGLSVNISNINEASVAFGVAAAENGYAATTRAQIGDTLAPAGNSPYKDTIGGFVNLVYGQDLGLALKTNIAKGAGTDGNIATDPLKNTAWNNSTLLFSGTFGATRPVFGTNDANVFTSATAVGQATVVTSVRGDSLFSLGLNTPATAGLRPGDANRDGAVGAADSALLFSNWSPAGTTKGWDTGDFNNSGGVGAADSALLFSNWNPAGTAYVPPTVAAVPEPATVGLAGAALVMVGGMVRRRR